MRDGIVNGKNFGLSDFEIGDYKRVIPGINTAVDYQKGKVPLGRTAKGNSFRCTEKVIPVPGSLPGHQCTHVTVDRFNWTNDYDQLMSVAVGDQAFNWPYFNPAKYKPDGSVDVPPNTRVIYSPLSESAPSP